MVFRVISSLCSRSTKLLVGAGTVGFISWRHSLAARMAEEHSKDELLVLIAVDASKQAHAAVECKSEYPHKWEIWKIYCVCNSIV